jgi:hypothetical protein
MAMGEMAEWVTRHERTEEVGRAERYGLTAGGAIADDPGAATGSGQVLRSGEAQPFVSVPRMRARIA